MHWTRVFLAWLLIIVGETLNGTVRRLWIAPAIGDLRARQLGVLTGSVVVFLVALLSRHWIGARTCRQCLLAGGVWVLLTIVFEIGLGRMLGYSWQRLLADYNPLAGGLMGAGLLFMLFAPALAATIRRPHRVEL